MPTFSDRVYAGPGDNGDTDENNFIPTAVGDDSSGDDTSGAIPTTNGSTIPAGAPPKPPIPPKVPCAPSGKAPSPSFYQEQGLQAKNLSILSAMFPFAMGRQSIDAYNMMILSQFHRGGTLDAQVRYGGSPTYANYVYGVYLAAAGWTLTEALQGADFYAALRSSYPKGTPMDPIYKSVPAANFANITAGFNAEKNGTLCQPQ